jgi:hypothetical protein
VDESEQSPTEQSQEDKATESAQAPTQPPEEEWPTHGGYLGCFLALLAGCLFAGFFASPLVQHLQVANLSGHGASNGYGPLLTIIAIAIMIAGLIVFGRIGWIIGKRVYKEYPTPARQRAAGKSQSSEEAISGDQQP